METFMKYVLGHILDRSNVFLFMGGLALLISSCDTEYIPDLPVDGFTSVSAKEGNFSLDIRFANFGETDTLPSLHSLQPETEVIQVNDDLSIYATLAVDPVVKAPAVTTRKFAVDARIRIIAYEVAPGPNYTQVFDELYTVNSLSALNRVSAAGDIILPAGTYKLVAYSYNDSTISPVTPLPFYIDTIKAIDPVNDLIWGESVPTPVVDGILNSIQIKMFHKLSQVKLVATSGLNGPLISAFSDVTMPGYTVDLTTLSGALAKNTSVSQSFDFPILNKDTVKATPRTVYTGTPGDLPTIIRIGSMTVGGKILTDVVTAAFAKSLQSGYSYTMTMTIGNSPNITENIPTNFLTYVGAFWKKNQTGERLIRLPRMSNGTIDGVWTAQVIEGRNWILLDTLMTTDPNVGWRSGANEASVQDGNDPLFESNPDRQLSPPTASTFVCGVVSPSGGNDQIYFRIGASSQYTPTSTNPVRYGVVLLTYGNNKYRNRIWIRQGEDPDFLMRKGDPDLTGVNIPAGGRPNVAKFSPYNLTDPNKNTATAYGATNNILAVNGATFVDYPSKAGYFFQWRSRQAFHPTSSISGWGSAGTVTAATTWNTNWETCPSGYRRPTDITATGTNDSEMRQTLWITGVGAQIPSTNNTDNIVWGYYADGYFDRRQIVQGVTANPALLTAVASPGAEVAYRGMLFYNKYNNASLFFPVTGYIPNGTLTQAGKSGHSWTKTNVGTQTLQIGFDPTAPAISNMNNQPSDYAYPIRCVVNGP